MIFGGKIKFINKNKLISTNSDNKGDKNDNLENNNNSIAIDKKGLIFIHNKIKI